MLQVTGADGTRSSCGGSGVRFTGPGDDVMVVGRAVRRLVERPLAAVGYGIHADHGNGGQAGLADRHVHSGVVGVSSIVQTARAGRA